MLQEWFNETIGNAEGEPYDWQHQKVSLAGGKIFEDLQLTLGYSLELLLRAFYSLSMVVRTSIVDWQRSRGTCGELAIRSSGGHSNCGPSLRMGRIA